MLIYTLERPSHGLRWGAAEQGGVRQAAGGKLSVSAAPPRRFPCSLDPSPSSSSGASTGAGRAASRELGEFPSGMLSMFVLAHGLKS